MLGAQNYDNLTNSFFVKSIVNQDILRNMFYNSHKMIAYDFIEPNERMTVEEGLYKSKIITDLIKYGMEFMLSLSDISSLSLQRSNLVREITSLPYSRSNESVENNPESPTDERLCVSQSYNSRNGIGPIFDFNTEYDKIQEMSDKYIKIWTICGLNIIDELEIFKMSELIHEHGRTFWNHLTNILSVVCVKNLLDSFSRPMRKSLLLSDLLYPCLQLAEMYTVGANICQINYGRKKFGSFVTYVTDKLHLPPIPIIYQHEFTRLTRRKLQTRTALVFMEDTPENIIWKIKQILFNPLSVDNQLFEYIKYIIWPYRKTLLVRVNDEIMTSYLVYDKLVEDYLNETFTIDDFRDAIANELINLLRPITDKIRLV